LDGITYCLLARGISKLFDFDSSGHGLAQIRIGAVRFILHFFQYVRVAREQFVYPPVGV
jgi:hypothetical protein